MRHTYGQGWVLEEQSGNFKVQKIEGPQRDAQGKAAKRPTICTNIAFAPSSGTALQVLIGELLAKMADFNLALYAAFELTSKAPEKGAGGSVNWQEVAKRYEASRVVTGQVKAATCDREERRRIERTIELINTKGRGAANDGPGVMRTYISQHLADLKLGGVGRERALLDVYRLLRFTVKKCGAEAS